MLAPSAKQAISSWRERKDIILLDDDSNTATSGGILDGLATKFEREGFSGRIWFFEGGYSAIESASMSTKTGLDIEGPKYHADQTPGNDHQLITGQLGQLPFMQGMNLTKWEALMQNLRVPP